MTLDERLRETFEAQRFDMRVPDVETLRVIGLARRRRHDRALAGLLGVLVVIAVGAAVATNRSSERATVPTGPDPRPGVGPAPGPNVVSPHPERMPAGVGAPWLVARTGIDDRQLVVRFNPLRPLSCPVVTETSVVTSSDRVEVGLLVTEAPEAAGSACEIVGPPHVVVELPEPLAGRPVFDLADPAEARSVLDGSTLQVPTVLPGSMTLVEERILSNPQDQLAWSQTYGVPGQGSLIVAQSATHGRALGGAYLAAAAPDDAPATLEATEPIRAAEVAQLGGDEVVEITVAVYRELPDGRVADVALIWRVDGVSYAMRLRSETGLEFGELVAVARSMQTV